MKNINYNYFLIAVILVCSISSCNKVIDLKLNNNSGDLVIEGNVTNVKGPQYVKLSLNVPFTNTNTYPAVSGATVTINDQAGNNYTLTESPAGTYTVNQLAGLTGSTYTMTVLTGGVTYKASSVMPVAVALDSVTTRPSVINSKKRIVTVHYQDPAGPGNQYRFLMYVNGVQVKSIFAFNDDFTDGRYVHMDLREQDIDIYPGDAVTIEMQCIDKPVYTYWYTLVTQQLNGPGGGVTPTNPPTNISPVVLGYFSAHTTQSKTITAK